MKNLFKLFTATLAVAAFTITALTSCSDDDKTDPDPKKEMTGPPAQKTMVSCDWLEQGNCWKQAVAKLSACRDPQRAHGRLSSQLDSCTLGDGAIVRFNRPLNLPQSGANPGDSSLEFNLERHGRSCAHLTQTAELLSIELTSGPVVSWSRTAENYMVSCGDGIGHVISQNEAAKCAAFHLPALRAGWTPTSLSATVDGAGSPQDILFSCAR